MIIVKDVGVYITPDDISGIKKGDVVKVKEKFNNNEVSFIVSDEMNDTISSVDDETFSNHLYEAYKIGILRLFLERIFPEKKNPEYFELIKNRFQVFMAPRTMQSRITLFNKNQDYFFL